MREMQIPPWYKETIRPEKDAPKKQGILSKLLNVIRMKALPVALLAAVGAGVAGKLSYNHETDREKLLPLGFSEISQIERDNASLGSQAEFDSNNVQVNERTYAYASLNDLIMKILECHNVAAISSDSEREFAKQLKIRFDPNQRKHHYELCDLFPKTLANFQELGKQAEKIRFAKQKVSDAAFNLENAWTEDHHHNYEWRLVPYVETYVNSNGDVKTRSGVRMEHVYVNTAHNFRYFREHGIKAIRDFDYIAGQVKDVRLPGAQLASKTNVQGEETARRTRKGGEKFASDKIREIANKWYSGATLTMKEQELYPKWEAVLANADLWRAVEPGAANYREVTSSRVHYGPREFQIAGKAGRSCRDLALIAGETLACLDKPIKELPKLRERIEGYISAYDSGSDEKLSELGSQVLRHTKEIYKENFNRGFDVQGFRIAPIVLFSLMGGFLGAGAGLGVSYAVNKAFKRDNPYSLGE